MRAERALSRKVIETGADVVLKGDGYFARAERALSRKVIETLVNRRHIASNQRVRAERALSRKVIETRLRTDRTEVRSLEVPKGH